jgi:hypothetical protein
MQNRCRVSEDLNAYELSQVTGGMDIEVLTDKEKIYRGCYEDKDKAYDIEDHMLGFEGLKLDDLRQVMTAENDFELLKHAKTLKDRLNRLALDIIND